MWRSCKHPSHYLSKGENIMSYQKLIIAGNLGRDPEMKYLPNGDPVTNLNVATNRKWTDKNTGQPQEETTWFKVSVWGPQAEACNQYLHKGSQVLVEGRLRPDPATGSPRMYETKDGFAGTSFEVKATDVRFFGQSGHNGNGGNGSGLRVPPAMDNGQESDDIPF
jgi:single-strand DNA-binding protein